MANLRIQKIIELLPENIDAMLVTSKSNIRYLTGFNPDDAGRVLVTRNKAYFIIDSRYIEAAQKVSDSNLDVILESDNRLEQIRGLCFDNSVKSICLERNHISVSFIEKLKDALCDIIFDSYDAGELISTLRYVKDESEINNIKKAQEITDNAFSYILERIEAGRSERELALELEFYMRKNGADAVSFDIIFIGGSNTSLPHGVPSDYKFQNGDLITMDFGADYNGYKSDMTRTIALGFANEKQKEIYNIVLEAQTSAINAIKAGAVCSDIDAVARNIIKDNGYGQFFGHSLGHSVGLDIHESPNFSPKCDKILKPSMVLTVEPGIYLPGKFGVRTEDLVVICENGVENLTKSNKSLIIV